MGQTMNLHLSSRSLEFTKEPDKEDAKSNS